MYCHHTPRPHRVEIDIKNIEYVCIKMTPAHGRQMQVCCVYRPPSAPASWKDTFCGLCNVLVSELRPCILLGDFNIDLLTDRSQADDMAATFDFIQHITAATRITSTTASLIDHVYTSGLENMIVTVTELHIADHCGVSCWLKLHLSITSNIQRHSTCQFRSMKNLNHDALNKDLGLLPYTMTASSEMNIDDMLNCFNKEFLDVWNKHAPLVSKRVRKQHTLG